jgi:DnaJ-class molecular chaperone
VADDDRSADDECMACRGTGEVISTLGGEERRVECPWCEGTGKRIPEHDAQARRREREGGGDEPPPAAA